MTYVVQIETQRII